MSRNLQRAADAYLTHCFARETPPHVGELAAYVRMTPSTFSRRFLAQTGMPPSRYLKTACLMHAMELLRATDLPMNVIAYRCGFGTRITFFRTFQRVMQMTPTTYRFRRPRQQAT